MCQRTWRSVLGTVSGMEPREATPTFVASRPKSGTAMTNMGNDPILGKKNEAVEVVLYFNNFCSDVRNVRPSTLPQPHPVFFSKSPSQAWFSWRNGVCCENVFRAAWGQIPASLLDSALWSGQHSISRCGREVSPVGIELGLG